MSYNDIHIVDTYRNDILDNENFPYLDWRRTMPRIIWDNIGDHFYENGVDHCVLYPVSTTGTYPSGVAWNGITSINESPSGADANKQWADNINYLTLYGAEEFGATIEAFTYPDEFAECDGSATLIPGVTVGQQNRRGFGLCYRTKIGNDTVGQDYAFKLHLIYGCRAAPSDRSYETINDSPDPITFSWEISTTPIAVPDHKPSAHIIIDSRDFTTTNGQKALNDFMDILYGVNATTGANPVADATARLPLPDEVIRKLTFTD